MVKTHFHPPIYGVTETPKCSCTLYKTPQQLIWGTPDGHLARPSARSHVTSPTSRGTIVAPRPPPGAPTVPSIVGSPSLLPEAIEAVFEITHATLRLVKATLQLARGFLRAPARVALALE